MFQGFNELLQTWLISPLWLDGATAEQLQSESKSSINRGFWKGLKCPINMLVPWSCHSPVSASENEGKVCSSSALHSLNDKMTARRWLDDRGKLRVPDSIHHILLIKSSRPLLFTPLWLLVEDLQSEPHLRGRGVMHTNFFLDKYTTKATTSAYSGTIFVNMNYSLCKNRALTLCSHEKRKRFMGSM